MTPPPPSPETESDDSVTDFTFGDFDEPQPASDALGFNVNVDYLTYHPAPSPPPKDCDAVTVQGRTFCRRDQEIVPPEDMVVCGLSTLQESLDGHRKNQEAFLRSAKKGTKLPLRSLLEIPHPTLPFSLSSGKVRQIFKGQLSLDIRSKISAAKEKKESDEKDSEATGTKPQNAEKYDVAVQVRLVLAELSAPGYETVEKFCLAAVQDSTTVTLPSFTPSGGQADAESESE